MHRRSFLLAAAALLAAPPAVAEDSPAATLTAIYRRVTSGKGDQGGAFMLQKKDRPKYFSKSLVALWAAAEAKTPKDEVGPVDFDPVSNSQDPQVKAFLVKVEKSDAARATVAVSIADKPGAVTPGKANTLHYTLVREGGRWMIDDIAGLAGDQAWDLREMLNNPG